MTTTTGETVMVLGRDANGIAVAEVREQGWSMRYYLTECCNASAKGSIGAIVCRACYEEVGWEMGDEPMPLVETFGDGLTYDEYVEKRAAGVI